MSMVARFVQITPVVLQHYVNDPSEVDELFDAVEAPAQKMAGLQFATSDAMKRPAESTPQMLTATLERMDPRLRQQLEKRLAALGVDIEALQAGRGGEQLVKLMQQRVGALMATAPGGHAVSGSPAGQGAAAALSLEKAWHGVHYLLCGDAELGASMLSRVVMGGTELGDDNGYGPARYFAPEEVAEAARELDRSDLERDMRARFNPTAMSRAGIYPASWAAPDRDWLIGEFRRLRGFYAEAAARGNAVITCIV